MWRCYDCKYSDIVHFCTNRLKKAVSLEAVLPSETPPQPVTGDKVMRLEGRRVALAQTHRLSSIESLQRKTIVSQQNYCKPCALVGSRIPCMRNGLSQARLNSFSAGLSSKRPSVRARTSQFYRLWIVERLWNSCPIFVYCFPRQARARLKPSPRRDCC